MPKHCQGCGHPIDRGAAFCSHCDAPAPAQSAARTAPAPATPPIYITQRVAVGGQKKNGGWGCGLILLLVVSCCVWSKMKDGCEPACHSGPPPPSPNAPAPVVNPPAPEPETSHQAEYKVVLTFLGTPKDQPHVRGVLTATTAGVDAKEMIDIAYDGHEQSPKSFRADSFSLYPSLRAPTAPTPDKVSVAVSRDGHACDAAVLMEASRECLLKHIR